MKVVPSIKCYLDISSAHCWFAFETLLRQNRVQNYELDFIPVHAASIMGTIGHKMPYYEKPLRDYNFYDIDVMSKYYGVEAKLPKNPLERLSNIGTFNAMRFVSLAKELESAKIELVWRCLFSRIWQEDKEIHEDIHFDEIVEKCGLSKSIMDVLKDEKWTFKLMENNKEAISQGCFGVPWIKAEVQNESESFFGADRIPLIRYASKLPAELRLRPFFLGAVMRESGNQPPAMLPAKGIYGKNDLQYTSKYWGVPLNQPSDFFNNIIKRSTVAPMRFLTALERKNPEKVPDMARAFWMRLWSRDLTIHDEASIKAAASEAGLSPQLAETLLKESNTTEIKELLKQRTDEAIESGAFGAPWIVIREPGKPDKTFFGSDRLPIICNELGVEFQGPLKSRL
ncbi:hypothetical protein FO519_006478 [Halicephalobus sp. NKZ332]|nr:hypothetical protein FO519_006478 [Halicephalobus sp. NKZ332]